MLRTVTATRYVTPLREGGSLPAVVEADDDGLYVLKFRGAGQGPKALIAGLVAGELDVLEEFMPEPLSEDELEEIVDDVIAEVGATSMRDIGRVMADVMPQVAGRADGSAVSQLVREKLA